MRRRYAIVGLGGRHIMYREAVLRTFADRCELAAVCDVNPGRVRLAQQAAEADGSRVPGYGAEAFDRLLAETRPDVVIVTSRDSTHDTYIVRALEAGCDVITEKPMTIDAARCRRILEACRRTGRHITVTFNYRYAPARTQVKELLLSGVIGEVLSVDFHWLLDVHHGADYFRRWHRQKAHSGGLLVHKATHHFDLVNWWLSTVPERVYAEGHRRFYTPATAQRYGLTRRAERCHGCPDAARCPFFLDLERYPNLKRLYLDCESYDGYLRDRCVFSEDIDIEDCVTVTVAYRSGAKMSYSLNAFMPWEGYIVAFNGTRGRLEHKCEETVYINADGSVPGALRREGTWIRIYPHWRPAYEVPVREADGGHGGADPVMLQYLFTPDQQPPDPLFRAADERAGAFSILTGIAANHSLREGRPVSLSELVSDLQLPLFPPMPQGDEPLPGKPTPQGG